MVLKTDKRIAKFIEDRVYVDNMKLDLKAYAAFKLPYELNENKTMLLAGRQVGKTVYLGTKLAVKSLLKHPNRALYVAPLESHTKSFSKTKLQNVIDSTPELKAIFTGKGTQSDVFFKKNILGDFIELTYASMGAEDPVRVRGKSADDLYIDEAQDVDYDVLPAIEEVTTSAKAPVITYAGTAKSKDNTTGVIWDNSNMMERIIKCTYCKKYNIIDRRNISKKGLVCNKTNCRKPLYVEHGVWAQTGSADAIYKAFRIPQVVLPYHNTEDKWKEIWSKYMQYTETKFNQEVLGIPAGSADRFLTIEKLKKKCTGGRMRVTCDPEWRKNYHAMFMGIDWTGNGVLMKSRTVALIIGHRKDGVFEMVWGKIFPPGGVNEQPKELINMAQLFQCQMVGADAGMGMIQNKDIMDALGTNRFKSIQYVGTAGNPFKFLPENNTINLHKTKAIDTIMGIFVDKFMPRVLTKGRTLNFIFPDFDDCRNFLEDILAEHEEETRSGNKIWTHDPMKPDDTLHAIVFAMYAYMHYKQAVSFY